MKCLVWAQFSVGREIHYKWHQRGWSQVRSKCLNGHGDLTTFLSYEGPSREGLRHTGIWVHEEACTVTACGVPLLDFSLQGNQSQASHKPTILQNVYIPHFKNGICLQPIYTRGSSSILVNNSLLHQSVAERRIARGVFSSYLQGETACDLVTTFVWQVSASLNTTIGVFLLMSIILSFWKPRVFNIPWRVLKTHPTNGIPRSIFCLCFALCPYD